MVQWLVGLTAPTLRRHYQLVPLLISIGAGSMMAALYTLRLATKNPDVSWNKKTNPYPWDKYMNKQYKFYAARVDYSTVKPPPERPNI